MTVTFLTHQQRTRSGDDGRITVTVPIRMVRRGKTHIVCDSEAPMLFAPPEIKSNLVKALVTAFRWKAMIDSGAATSMKDIADKERLGDNYESRLMKLTLLAPDIVEAILNGRQPKTLSLIDLLASMPPEWAEQRRIFGFPERTTTK